MSSDNNYKVVKLINKCCSFVYMTDLHLSATPPGRREGDYGSQILSKVEYIRQLTERINGVCLCGGDIWHVKNPKSISNNLGFLNKVIETFRKFPMGCVYSATGNHDISGDRMETIPTQPIGVLFSSGVCHNLNEEPVIFTNEDATVRVLVETFPYEHTGEGALQRLLATGERPKDVTHRIGIVHAYGEPGNGGGMFGEAIGYNQIQHLDYDFLLWGHDHSRHETVKVGTPTHVNLGSLARAAYDYDELDRPVVATILSFSEEGVKYKEKEIPVTPLAIAFKSADKVVVDVAKSEEIKEFFAAMDEQVEGIESTDPREVLKTLCPADEPELLETTLELCELT